MEAYRRDDFGGREKEIAFSRSVKAGKRIYYLDVKHNRNDDLYLSLTESKKKISGNPDNPDVSYEKHKIFLYKEDLSKFTEALIDVIRYMQNNDVTPENQKPKQESLVESTNITDDLEPAIKFDLDDFE